MRTIRLTAITTALATAAVLTPNPAVAAPKKPVKMRFAVSATTAQRGTTVNLTGRAHYKTTGNRARVDIYFAKTGAGYKWLTSATATAHGDFTKKITATTTGTYKAVYRGNTKRKQATAADTLTVFVNQTVTKTIFSHTEENADCAADCTFSGPTIKIANTPITVTGTLTCERPKPGMTIAFTGAADNALPAPNPGTPQAGPGWIASSYRAPGTVVLPTPPSTTGHFYVHVSSGWYSGMTAICDWSVIARQNVTETVTV